jgi:hypothetical protein
MSRQPSDFYIFNFEAPGLSTEDVIAFTASPEIDAQLLAEALRAHLDRASPPSRLFVLGPAPGRERLVEVAGGEDLADALPAFTRWLNPPPVIPLAYEADGALIDLSGRVPEAEAPDFATVLLRTGLRRVFNENTGMLRAPAGFHYVNPSGRHTLAFIRAGNVLLHSAEISFVAMGLLRFWPEGVRRIFVDTASISSLAYALVGLRRVFEPGLLVPSIDTFSSYEGVDSFAFEPHDALCLISASTSGGLEKRIIDAAGVPAERIVTIFYCGTQVQEGQILCDLTAREGLPGEEPIRSFGREADCEMCRRGSAVVHISGDQFLPADPEVRDRMLTAADVPTWLAPFLERVGGQRIVRCHGGSPGRLREIYLDLGAATTADGRFAEALDRRLAMALPASLGAIVHVGDPSSAQIAEVLRDRYEAGSGGAVEEGVLDIAEVYEERRVLPEKITVAVVAAAASSGRALLGVSQYLRNVAKTDRIVYLVGAARATSREDWQRIESSLTFGEAPSDFPLFKVCSAYLPGDRGPQGTPWEAELIFLAGVRDLLIEQGVEDPDALAEIAARRRQIEEAEASDVGGLTDDVFLPAVKDGTLSLTDPDRLTLAPGFVFWRGVKPELIETATQAEVYLTVLAVLHSLRRKNAGGMLVQHEHNRTVLAPANLARFNDAVVQAALLRAALPRELDYSHDKTLSRQMRGILTRFFEHRIGSEGRAAPEFLYALARRQIQLHDDDMRALRKTLAGLDLPPLMRALRIWMEHRHRGTGDPDHEPTAASLAG